MSELNPKPPPRDAGAARTFVFPLLRHLCDSQVQTRELPWKCESILPVSLRGGVRSASFAFKATGRPVRGWERRRGAAGAGRTTPPRPEESRIKAPQHQRPKMDVQHGLASGFHANRAPVFMLHSSSPHPPNPVSIRGSTPRLLFLELVELFPSR